MKIQKIQKITGHRIFRNYSWPTTLQTFKRFNLIYGWNGSGKTSITTLFQQLESEKLRELSAINVGSNYIFEFDNNLKISKSEVENGGHVPPIKVFNLTFINSVLEKTKGGIAPIFQIGVENIEKAKLLQSKQDEIKIIQRKLVNAGSEEAEKLKVMERMATDNANSIKSILRIHTSYRAPDFKKDLDNIKNDIENKILSEESYQRKLRLIDQKRLPDIEKISIEYADCHLLSKTVADLLKKKPAYNAINKFENNKRLSDWVKEGLKVHENNKDQCEFCLNDLSEERLQELNNHFNEEYKDLLLIINIQIGKLQRLISEINFHKYVEAEIYDEFWEGYREKIIELDEDILKYIHYLSELKSALEKKEKKPTLSKSFNFIVPVFNAYEIVGSINKIIDRQQVKTKEFDESILKIKNEIKSHLIAKSFANYQVSKIAHDEAVNKLKDLRNDRNVIDEEISRLKNELHNFRLILPSLNQILRDFLGREDIQFKVKDSGYQIIRKGGEVASHLSEGEKTAIAFSYFLMSLEDDAFSKKEGVIVIDDPISSLDANAVYYAYSVIEQRLSDINQLFIFTHNFAFFRQIKRWLSKRSKGIPNDISYFYQLKRIGNRIELEELDKLLCKYDSEYHYLFKLTYENSQEEGGDAEVFFHMPNISRRLLEAFMAYRKPIQTGNYKKSLRLLAIESTSFKPDEQKNETMNTLISEIERFTQIHSHNERIDDFGEDFIAIISKAPSVLSNILQLIKETAPNHYREMVKLCEP